VADQPREEATPGQLATFDQAHAEVAASLDVLIASFNNIRRENYEPREMTIAAQGMWLREHMHADALAEHLTVAIDRLAEREDRRA
jgi:hypothetical protein